MARSGRRAEQPPSPGPTPSSSPDAAKSFSRSSRESFAAHCAISGRLTVGSAPYPLSGAFDVGGGDSHQVLTVATPGAPQTSESIKAAGIDYVKRGALWFVKPAEDATSSKDLASVLRTMLDVRDTGTELKDGRLLHHLESRGGASIPLSAIGSADPAGDGVVSIDFYVEDDGTPALMEIEASWTQVSGSPTARHDVDPVPLRERTTRRDHRPAAGLVDVLKRCGLHARLPVRLRRRSPKKSQPDSILSADKWGLRQGYPDQRLLAQRDRVREDHQANRHQGPVASNTAVTVDGSKARRTNGPPSTRDSRVDIDVLIVRGEGHT
jgi:hypothetical protein